MKSVKLVFTLALLTCLVAMTALAGGVDKKAAVSSAQSRGQLEKLDFRMADIPADRSLKSTTMHRVDAEVASPQAEAINAAALSKYPTVSAAGLSGVYTIPGDFGSLASAISVLNFVGLDGDATFELTASSYSELAGSTTIGSYPNAGTYNLTITPSLGVDATITWVTTGTAGKGLAFNGASNVTVNGVADDSTSLTLAMDGTTFPYSDAFGSTVYITGASSDITVENATVRGLVNDPVWENQTDGRSAIFIWSGLADPNWNEDIEFDNVTIINATYGMKVFPEDAYQPVNNLVVNNCKFGGAFGGRLIIGAWTDYAQNVTWTNNQFKDLYWLDWYWNNAETEYDDEIGFGIPDIRYNMGQMTAFHHIATLIAEVAYNDIDGLSGDVSPSTISYGTRTYAYDNTNYALFHHNRIQNVFLDHAGQSLTGLRGPTTYVYHNTIRLTGTKTVSTTWNSTCLNGVTFAYNNVFSNEIAGGAAGTRRGVTAGGTIDYNAIYSSGVPVTGQATVAAAVGAGVNPNGVYGPAGTFDAALHITGGVTAAKEIGKAGVIAANDIDGSPIDTTFAGKRDAGADQFSPLGSFVVDDVMPTAIPNPPAGGVPAGVSQTPTVTVKNNSQTPASFNVQLDIAPDGYTDTKPVSLGAGESKTISFAGWTPAAAGPRTITATTLLGGDAVPGNDVLARAQAVDAPVVIAAPTLYDFNASASGWTGAIDWVRSNTFTKLGGVNGGAGYSWVTQRPTDPSTYTEGAYATSQGYGIAYPGANLLTSPWLDLSTLPGTDLYISFQHSIETEPLWDRSWLQYTTDGINWIDLGVLNEPDGINWYNESLYEHAALDPANFDDATATGYGLGTGPPASWTSNDNGTTGTPGDFIPTGPSGWVYAQLKITTTSHPAAARAGAIRFRYVAFSDAVSSFGGWAFDNFNLSNAAPVFGGGTISGHAWIDANGNGTDDGEADYVGTKVYVSLFGSVVDSVLTNGTGDYSWSGVTLPAAYDLKLNVSGVAYTVPFGVSGIQSINHGADGSTISGVDFGTFAGSISGKKYSDVNDNGANDAEPGLAGWTIEVHMDSAAGTFLGSAVTDGSGNYSILAPAYAGTYVVTEVEQPLIARQTGPVGGEYSVSINGGTPTSTGNDFGNFVYARFRVHLNVDQDGDGVKDPGDIIAIPSGSTADFKITKDGVGLTPDSLFTLGNGVIGIQFSGLDLGTYDVTEVTTIPGWVRTLGGTNTLVVDQSNESDTAFYLDFKLITITGKKYDDLNGNGALDGGEPGLAGWTINVSGGSYQGATSAVTDVNGDYSIDSVFNGAHTVSEVAQAGYTQTAPVGGTYAINGISGNLINTTGKNFGNYADATVSGIVYRDYNGNGAMDPGDSPMSGVAVDLLVSNLSTASSGTGYLFSGMITADSIAVTAPVGYVVTQPIGGIYEIGLTSGGSAANMHFGLFQSSDGSTTYRTFTAAQLGADDQKKPGKKPKIGASKIWDPVKNKPTTANLVDALLNPKTGVAPGAVQVGLDGQLNLGGKTKAFVKPNKQSSFWQSLNNKSVHHTGMARGFDLDLKGKPILKLQKAFAPNKKQNNRLFAELVVLELNLVASSNGRTPVGLGALLYSDPNSTLDGMTLDEIADYADTVMTNFEFVPLGVYNELDTVVAKINGAFYNAAVDDTTLDGGWASPYLKWKSYTAVVGVPFLKPNPGVAPKQRKADETVAVPMAFALEQNYPNPFNPTTTIEFEVPEASLVTLKVYNLLGQEVATLLDRQEVEFGESVEFDASTMPSGVYLYRIVAETIADEEAGIGTETFTQVKKMVLVK